MQIRHSIKMDLAARKPSPGDLVFGCLSYTNAKLAQGPSVAWGLFTAIERLLGDWTV